MNPHSEVGQSDKDGAITSARVLEYMQAAGVDHPETQDAPYWGPHFLAWLAIRQGITPPVNAGQSEAWRSWGHPAAEPAPGCIVILTDGGGRRQHLVGIVERVAGDKLYVIGGDMDGQVGTKAFSMGQVIECRKPPQGTAALPAQSSLQDVRLVIEHQGAAMPAQFQAAPMIEHVPASPDENLRREVVELRRTVTSLQQQIDEMRHMLSTLEITPLDEFNNPIPWSDFVRRSQLTGGTHGSA